VIFAGPVARLYPATGADSLADGTRVGKGRRSMGVKTQKVVVEPTRTYDLAALPPRDIGRLRAEIRHIKATACELASHEQCATEELDLDAIVKLGLDLQARLNGLQTATRKLAGGLVGV